MKEYRKIRSERTFSCGDNSDLTGGLRAFFFAVRQLAASEVVEPTKSSMFDLDIKKKLEVLEFADKLDDVTETARLNVVSRAISYRHQKLIKMSEGQALKNQIRTEKAIASSNLLSTIRTWGKCISQSN